ncbi:hypothetical protein HKCCE2091_06230 [Rhodobacterales bacterium HKCCE2091]|nr:hypothetical protein [Rhodobacterales bacterium HKCCE2091]
MPAVLLVAAAGSPAAAQDIPSSFRSPGFAASDRCDDGLATDAAAWVAGRRGPETRVVTVERVCGDTEVEWQGLAVPIRWQDGQHRIYTDCRDDGASFFCWITVPG